MGVVVLGLAALVAVASQDAPIWAPSGGGPVDRREMLANIAVVGALGIIASLSLTLVVHRALLAGRPGAPSARATLIRALPLTAVGFAVLALLVIGRTDLAGGADGSDSAVSGELAGNPSGGTITDSRQGLLAGDDRRPDEGEGVPGGDSPIPGGWLIGAAVVAVAILGAAFRSWYASRWALPEQAADGDDGEPGLDVDALRDAVVDTIESMLADPDPNTAIIGAYARLLQGLDACGVGRREHEGPLEHLHRVLATLRVRPEPLRQLIGLFEIARFSTRSLTPAHRLQALDALRAAAADFAAIPAPQQLAAARPAGA